MEKDRFSSAVRCSCWILICVLVASWHAFDAHADTVGDDGVYVYIEGGNGHGTLTLKNGQFTIETLGGNCSTCSLEGQFKGTTGYVTDGQICRISFTVKQEKLVLKSDGTDACRSLCGMRAEFDGKYQKPSQACGDDARASRLSQARGEYSKKDYPAAAAQFRSLIDECSTFMNSIEADRVKSDLALTYHHMGDQAQCLATLSTTVAIENRDAGDDASFGLPPCERTTIGRSAKPSCTTRRSANHSHRWPVAGQPITVRCGRDCG
jgi:hypothetical protein